MTKVDKTKSKSGDTPRIETGSGFRHWQNAFKASCILQQKCYLALEKERPKLDIRELGLYLGHYGTETEESQRYRKDLKRDQAKWDNRSMIIYSKLVACCEDESDAKVMIQTVEFGEGVRLYNKLDKRFNPQDNTLICGKLREFNSLSMKAG